MCKEMSDVQPMYPGISMASAPTPASEMKMSDLKMEEATTIDTLRQTIKNLRRSMAFRIIDMFESLDKMDEKEFLEMISELPTGDGVVMSEMVEKFRKYKGI